MKSIATFVARIAGAASPALLAACAVACVAEPGAERVGEAQSALTIWDRQSFSSMYNLNGQTIVSGLPNCVLAGVQGDFDEGQSPFWNAESLFSEAGISGGKLVAHGGAYTDQNNQRSWANNDVGAITTCFDTQVTPVTPTGGGWGSGGNYAPVRIAGLGSSRVCYLQFLQAAAGSFASSSDFVQVAAHATTDSQHPTTGFYIEGQLGGNINNTGDPLAAAVCFDLPTPYEAGTYTVTSSAGQYATTTTYANYLSACALTRLTGPLTYTSLSTGVYLDSNSSGVWQLHAYGGQSGTAVCVDW